MGIRIKLPNSTRAGQEVGMEGFLSRKEPWEWIWTLDTLLLWFSSCSSLLLLAHVFYKIPTDPYGNYGCHRWVANPLLMQLEWWPGLSRLPFQNGIPGRRKFNVPSTPSLPHPPPPPLSNCRCKVHSIPNFHLVYGAWSRHHLQFSVFFFNVRVANSFAGSGR